MRYAIFSDVHANWQAWEAVLADIAQQGVDTLVCLGDVVGYGPKPLEVLAGVRAVTANFVLGNHDAAACGRLDPSIFNDRARVVIEWTREQLDNDALQFLGQVPLQMNGPDVYFVHAEVVQPGEFGYVEGVSSAKANLEAMVESLGFIGHTHLPLAYSMSKRGGAVTQLAPKDFQLERGQRYLVNVGSVGEPRTTDVRASYVIYDDATQTVFFRRVAFDVEAYKRDLQQAGLEILPYFVQVVDAGKAADAPGPAAAPQLALAHLPKVGEVVAGGQGHLVMGMPGTGGRPATGIGSSVSQPKSSLPWVLSIAALVTILIGIIAIGMMQGEEGDAGVEGETIPQSPERVLTNTAPTKEVERVDTVQGPIRDLIVQRFGKNFRSLAELRSEAGELNSGKPMPEGMLDLGAAGNEPSGLVWEGYLRVPERGFYKFSLEASSGAALLIYGEEQVSSISGSQESARVLCRKGHAPFRVEYFQQGGEQSPGLSLTWSGPGLGGTLSLVREVGSSGAAIAGSPSPGDSESTPTDPTAPGSTTEEQLDRKAPESMSEGLTAYWPLDRRASTALSRFTVTERGVEEKLIMKGQPLRYLRPAADPGALKWERPGFDDSNGWLDGSNGIGYEDVPGAFKELLETRIETAKGQHPHSLYLRIPFEVKDPKAYEQLALYIYYDDGFKAYLNGSELGSRNAPFPFLWNSGSAKKRNDSDAVKAEAIRLSARRVSQLVKGTNVLAIHALNDGEKSKPNATNTGCASTDMLILAQLVGLRKDDELPEESVRREPSKHELPIEDAMIKGEVKVVDKGRFGEAHEFGGGSLDIGSKNEFAIADQSFTASLWFTRNPGSTDGQARRLISAGAGSDQKAGWALWLQKDGTGLTFRVSDGDSGSDLTAKYESLVNGEWHHVAVVVERDSSRIQVFIDGALAAEKGAAALLEGKTIGASSGLCIGRNSDDQQHHSGKIDDVALWRRALLPEEIERIFQSEKSAGELFELDPLD